MAYDYTDDIAFAVESVAEYGRPVRFRKVNTAVDAANPLAGPTAAPVLSDAVPAVFVVLTGNNSFGISKQTVELMKASEQTAMIAPSGVDYEEFTHIVDFDNSVWKIDVIDKLMPGVVPVLYFIGVSRA